MNVRAKFYKQVGTAARSGKVLYQEYVFERQRNSYCDESDGFRTALKAV